LAQVGFRESLSAASMSSLADLVVDLEVDDLGLEDEELVREVEELKAQKEAARASTPSQATAPLAAANVKEASSLTTTTPKGSSLADQICGGEVEHEFEAMERELQQQLLAYREQCQAAPTAPTSPEASPELKKDLAPGALAEADRPTTVGSSSWPSRPSSKASRAGKEGQPAAGQEESGEAETGAPPLSSPELESLREEAATMERVFPEAEGGAEVQTRRRYRNAGGSRGSAALAREQVPVDRDTEELRSKLEGLDVRLGAIQQQHAIHDTLMREAGDPNSSMASKAISELQAQNTYLRERMKEGGKTRGLLQLDRSKFGAAGAGQTPFGGEPATASELC